MNLDICPGLGRLHELPHTTCPVDLSSKKICLSEDPALRRRMHAIERSWHDVGKIIAQHGNGATKVLYMEYKPRAIPIYRDKLAETARSQVCGSQSASGSLTGACLATMQTVLVSHPSADPSIQRGLLASFGYKLARDHRLPVRSAEPVADLNATSKGSNASGHDTAAVATAPAAPCPPACLGPASSVRVEDPSLKDEDPVRMWEVWTHFRYELATHLSSVLLNAITGGMQEAHGEYERDPESQGTCTPKHAALRLRASLQKDEP